MTRNIKIYTTNGMPGTVETNVSTVAELKTLLRQREINYDGMKMLVGETRNELSLDEAILPEGDFKLYLMPAKTKSGVDFDEMDENIDDILDRVENIEEKLDKVLNLLSNPISTPSVASQVSSLSAEDQREVEELRRLAGNSTSEWDD